MATYVEMAADLEQSSSFLFGNFTASATNNKQIHTNVITITSLYYNPLKWIIRYSSNIAAKYAHTKPSSEVLRWLYMKQQENVQRKDDLMFPGCCYCLVIFKAHNFT